MTDEDYLAIERQMRALKGSPEARRWQLAQSSFEYWAAHTTIGTCRDWAALKGSERGIWYTLAGFPKAGG